MQAPNIRGILVKTLGILAVLLLWQLPLSAANTLQIHDAQGEAGDTITIDVEIINDDPFVAFQFDLPLPIQLTYVANSETLTDRSVDHEIVASIVNDDTLRVLAYSPTNTQFTGNSGNVAYFELVAGSVPGNYPLNMSNPIIGDSNSTNILTNTINGILTILAPDIDLNKDSLDFDRTPLGNYTDRTFTLYNLGNQPLQVYDINFDSPYFSVVGDTAFTIPASAQQSVTVRFQSVIKGTYEKQLTIVSNDPDESNYIIQLNAIAFAVNEIHIGDLFAFSGDTATLHSSINNMEPFVAFQFDIPLPGPMTFIEGSAQLSDRKVNHQVSAGIIGEDTLRVVAYSPDNTPFSGSDGDILFIDFYIEGTGGYYPITATNVIIGDTAGDNILSDFYNGQLEIAAADIYGPDSLNFGEISLLDTLQLSLNIGNNGNDTLIIDQISFTDNSFWTTVGLPLHIQPSQEEEIPIYFSNLEEGTYQGLLRIYSNDPDESPFDIELSGTTFAPNYMIVSDTFASPGDTVLVHVDVDNYSEFVAFQFDLNFSDMLTYVDGSAQLTDRAQDHTLAASLIDSTQLRILAYSMEQKLFLGNSGPIVTMNFEVDSSCAEGSLPLILYNAILGDTNSNNILRDVQNGEVLIDTTAPEVVALASPDSGFMTNDSIVTFIWHQSTDNLSGIDHYILQYADNSDFISPVDTEVADTSYTTILQDTTYYWRVKSVDRATNESDWSDMWSLTIDTKIPGTPVLIYPIGGEYLNIGTVIFEWSEVLKGILSSNQYGSDKEREQDFSEPSNSLHTINSDPNVAADLVPDRKYNAILKAAEIRYVLQIDTSISFINPLVVDTVSSNVDSVNMVRGDYYWRVRAYDLAGNEGSFSSLDSFVVVCKGDVNDDSAINVLDLVRTVNIILRKPPVPTEYELFTADVAPIENGNPVGDGSVNILDVVALAYRITHNEWPDAKSKMVAIRLETTDYRLQTEAHRLQTTDYKPMRSEKRVVRSEEQAISQFSTTNHQLPVQAVLSVGNGSGIPGSCNNPVSITLKNIVPVGGIQFTLINDSLLLADSVKLTAHISHMNLSYNTWSDSVKILIYSVSGDSILPDSLPILQVFLSVDSQAVVDDSSLLHIKDCILCDPLAQPISCETQDGWFYFLPSTEVEEVTATSVLKVFTVRSNYPNPFMDQTVIRYGLPQKGKVNISIYNLLGQNILTLYEGVQDAGWHSIEWDGRDKMKNKIRSGVYFYHIKWMGKIVTKKMLVL